MNETWLPIPGLSKYEISRDLKVRNKRTGKLLTPNIRQEVRLRRDDDRVYTVRTYRLLYAALHGVRLDSTRKVVFYDEGNGKISLISSEELLARMRDNRGYIRPDVCCGYYKEALAVIEMILDAYETGDFSRIAGEIYKQEDLLVRHMVGNLGVATDTAREAFSVIAERMLTSIKEKTVTVYNVKSYLCRLANAYITERRKINKRIVHYDEAVLRHNAYDF